MVAICFASIFVACVVAHARVHGVIFPWKKSRNNPQRTN